MNDALKIGLLAAGGFLLLRAFMSQPALTPAAISTPITPVLPPQLPTPAQIPPPAPVALNSALVAQLNAAAPPYYQGSGTWPGTFTSSQWNWIRNFVVNPGSQPAQLSFPVDQQIDAATYVQALQSAGLAGYRRRPRTWRVA